MLLRRSAYDVPLFRFLLALRASARCSAITAAPEQLSTPTHRMLDDRGFKILKTHTRYSVTHTSCTLKKAVWRCALRTPPGTL
jgi:hypothetical protein